MSTYAIYDNLTGAISRVVTAFEGQGVIQSQVGESVLLVNDACQDDTHYIDIEMGELRDKANPPIVINNTSITSDGIDSATISNIPSWSDVFINGVFIDECNDGLVEITSDEAKTFNVRIEHVEFLDYEATIHAI